MSKFLPIWTLLSLVLVGCLGYPGTAVPPETFTRAAPSSIATLTATAVPLPTGTMSPTGTPQPVGCQKPPDDYTRVEVNGWTLNQRTRTMLVYAQGLYSGELEITEHAITQGSYHDNGSASFGTHLGGGAVDLSVMRRGTYTVLWDDVESLVYALRVAGFAAWLREYGELYADSPIHIHAIAIGDEELSSAAEEQLSGPAGYFRGYSGLPVAGNSIPTPDRHGGPILCQWMIELGYRDLR